MRQYPDSLLTFIQKEEGNVQSVRSQATSLLKRKNKVKAQKVLSRIHPSNSGEGLVWGAYYDSRNYLTAGSGTLISRNKRGSTQEAADIAKFKQSYGVDPFKMTKDQAKSLITVKLDENVDDYLRSKHGKDVEFDTLPNSAKLAVASLAYNVGGANLGLKGKNYSAALKKAAGSKKADDWHKFQKQQRHFHGKNVQEEGVMRRRQMEANHLDDLIYAQDASIDGYSAAPTEMEIPELLRRPSEQMDEPAPDEFDEVDDLFQAQPEAAPDVDILAALGNAIIPTAEASAIDPTQSEEVIGDDPLQEGFVLPDQQGAAPQPEVNMEGTMLEDTRFQQQQEQLNKDKATEDETIPEGISKFGDHLLNSFMTGNIVGSTVKNAVVNWDVDSEYDPSFKPTNTVGYDELVKDVPTERLKDVLESSNNEKQFVNSVIGIKMEQQARQEMSQYLATNPVKGFIGVGIASALDVTSFIPVSKLVRMTGVTKSFKGIPLLARNMGAQISENIVQDLVQETILTSNSDIRKWDDGDILYGMVGGVVIGGVAGKFKTNRTLAKFEKLATKMSMEKNLSSINMMIRSAERKGLGTKVVNELKQLRTVVEQSLQKNHQMLVMNELKVRQEALAKGLKETNRIKLVKEHAELVEAVEKQVDEEIAASRKSVDELRVDEKNARKAALKSVEDLKKANVGIEKRLKKLKQMAAKEQTADISNEITKLSRKLKDNLNRIKDGLKRSQTDAKKVKAERTKLIRKLGREDRDARVTELLMDKEAEMKSNLDAFEQTVDKGVHPEMAELINTGSLNSIATDLGLPKAFSSIDDLDDFLGVKFDDSVSSARVREQPSEYLKAQDVNEMFNKTDPELWNVVSRQFQESRENPALGIASFNVNKNSVAARIARATRMNEIMTTENVVGRFTLNKSALKWSNNEFASAFYNWAAPDGVGRMNGGKLSVIEAQQMLEATYGGDLRTMSMDAMESLVPHFLNNKMLRNDMGLPTNDLAARLMMTEAYFPERMSNLLRDEMIQLGNAKMKYGDEVGAIVDQWRTKFNQLSARVLKDAKEAKVVGTEALEETDNWFHRAWDNRAAMQFDITHGTKKMEELIQKGMKEWLRAEGKEITDAMIPLIESQAKKFAFGLRSKDTRVFMTADADYQNFMRRLLDADTDNMLDADLLKKEIRRVEQNMENRKERELARRKPISLTASVDIHDKDGKVTGTVQIRDLLESNILASQNAYMSAMAGRTASARNGILDVNLLDEWVDRAVELERRRGKLDHADYIERAMREDVESIKYGYTHREGVVDGTLGRLQRMAMKYNAARLMQYTGISSIAEMNTMIAEAGYKAVSQVIANNAVPLLKSYMFGGVTGKVFTNSMYDELSVIAGVGFEDISFDAMLSSSRMITASKAGNYVERVVDNAAKMTRRATGHVEVTGRRLALNSLALNYGNIALGRDSVSNLFGGVSNVNLVELGLAELVNGKAVKNKSWDDIMESIKKYALDEDGNVAADSGKGIRQFNLAKWDLKTRTKFGEVLAQQANHIVVNPDSTTAKLWHNTWWGAMFNQFRSFANNAQSKVAGHNLHQAMQGYRMGEMAEFSKLAQKYFWGAALGKLSLITYGAIHNTGREDFAERMEQYMGVDEMRDWTQALGRSSAITGFDTATDTLIGLGNLSGHMQVDPMFSSSTIGQSRDRLSWQTTATGQLAVGTAAIGTGLLKGDLGAAGKQALKMSPFRRQLGVNQLLNAMGVD